ncbi:DUF6182 family protein [Streptomyces sp. RY43-2]|uniref:DUF6182 family protein n=1 Tax=Streptomyces macrolidinus TaxID=2952607 RepID=A0ABT0ZH43_9ACTN|nr:DUF6182 family protein [Streptomyces macrolidinus]MCN9242904.1 DUF6182 family protein [Streptomyces macrolidinus]
MTTSQELLRAEVARRIATARPELAARFDLLTADGLLAAQREITRAAQDAKVQAVCVLRDFDLPTWVRATCAFAARVDASAAVGWRRDFTRTVFLAGNPDNLRDRFVFGHVADDGSAAWQGPAPAEESTTLRRLLKLFDGSAELPTRLSTVVRVLADRDPRGRAPVRRELHVATAGVTIADCLVHLNHLLVEAVLDEVVGPGDELVVRQAPWLPASAGLFAARRIDGTPDHPDRLRAYAALTGEIHDA